VASPFGVTGALRHPHSLFLALGSLKLHTKVTVSTLCRCDEGITIGLVNNSMANIVMALSVISRYFTPLCCVMYVWSVTEESTVDADDEAMVKGPETTHFIFLTDLFTSCVGRALHSMCLNQDNTPAPFSVNTNNEDIRR